MRLGNTDIASVKLGSSQVQAVYLGSNLVWQNAPVAIAATGVGTTSFTANWDAYTGATYYLLDVSASSDFSTFIYENQVTTSTSYVVIGLNSNTTYYYRVRANVGTDADAQAFFDRVTTAGGSLSATEQTAINTLVIQMKTDGIWTAMKAIYPMVGASAAACAQNLKSSSFTGTFTSGWTFASTGATPDGFGGWAETNLNVNTLATNSISLGYYSRTNTQTQSGHYLDASASTGGRFGIANFSGSYYVYLSNSPIFNNVSQSNSLGFFQGYRNNTSNVQAYKNSTKIISDGSESISSLIDKTFQIGRNSNTGTGYTNEECAFAYIGDGLTDDEASDLYTAVQGFNTTLDRSVGTPIVSDADAQAYINRVYTAGGTLTNTEANAVNQLTIDMKAAGIWNAMKAVYPMVGASAAACAQNLKSSSFTGTFSATGWTYSSTGVLNLGSGEFDTGLNLNIMNSINDISYGYYNRTNTQSQGSFGWGRPTALSPFNELWIKYSDGKKYGYLMDTSNDGGSVADCRGFNAMSRTASNNKFIQLNSTITTFTSASSGTLSSRNFIFGRGSQGFEDRENALGFIGDAITSQNMTDFYNAVQAFQTTLNRAIV